jgi:hypothetical protein
VSTFGYFLPSVALVAILADAFFGIFRPAERRAVLCAIALASVIVYPASLGYLPDVYRWGFQPVPIAIAAFLCIVVAEWSLSIGIFLLAGFAAFAAHLLPSRNLIDYFIDPVAAAIAIVWCVSQLWRPRTAAVRTP